MSVIPDLKHYYKIMKHFPYRVYRPPKNKSINAKNVFLNYINTLQSQSNFILIKTAKN